jgi:hypothetical protein
VPITNIVVSSNPDHFDVYSIHHYVIKVVSDLRQVGRWFSPGTLVSSSNKSDRYNWNIIESGVNHHNPNPWASSICLLHCKCEEIHISPSLYRDANFISRYLYGFPFGVCCTTRVTIYKSLQTIVLSVLLWFTDSGYLFGIFKLFLLMS